MSEEEKKYDGMEIALLAMADLGDQYERWLSRAYGYLTSGGVTAKQREALLKMIEDLKQ